MLLKEYNYINKHKRPRGSLDLFSHINVVSAWKHNRQKSFIYGMSNYGSVGVEMIPCQNKRYKNK